MAQRLGKTPKGWDHMEQLRNRFGSFASQCLAVGAVTLMIAGCGGGGGGGGSSGSSGGSSSGGSSQTTDPSDPDQNHLPQITGTPATSIQAGTTYMFQPYAVDSDNDTLTFQITNRPAWAVFDTTTGTLTGTPTSGNIGTSSAITISVSDGTASVALSAFSVTVQAATTGNRPPIISGTPVSSIVVAQSYNFQPTASDPDGDSLAFSITNRPTWATFNSSTGQLSGTPTSADVGTYQNISIRVSDGTTSTALATFSIAVNQITNGTATISWVPPTQNTDGSPLTDLGGYRIYYGTNSSALTQVAEISNPGITTYMIQNLSAATWYFSLRAYRTDGTESDPSNIVSKTIM
jgi:hypothetical protein